MFFKVLKSIIAKSSWIWDHVPFLVSVLGIWPRYIEPRLLTRSSLSLVFPTLSEDLQGLRIVHFSDLHISTYSKKKFLDKLRERIMCLEPHLICFTGDFLTYSNVQNKELLEEFLNSLSAKYGCFCILGNHDYEQYVTHNDDGDYDVVTRAQNPWKKAYRRLFQRTKLSGNCTAAAAELAPHKELLEIIKESPFTLLDNRTVQITVGSTELNVCGLGDHISGHADVETAYADYNPEFPGIVLAHSPDATRLLEGRPANLVLSGHTHAGQINLPWLRQRFIRTENPSYRYGLHTVDGKHVFVTRGVGSPFPFRFLAPPEILMVIMSELEIEAEEEDLGDDED